MKIVLMGQHYAPEEVSGAVLATHFITDLAQKGHQVTMVTCAPNYPRKVVFPGYKNRLFQKETLNGVRVVRIWSFIHPSEKFWPRILNYGTFSLMSFFGGLVAGKPDALVSYSPPLPLGVSAWLLSRLWKVPWIFRVEDLYPDAAVSAGVMTNRRVIRFFEKLELFLYNHASNVSVLSEGFRKRLLEKGARAVNISVTPIMADPDYVRPMEKENEFRKQHGLTGKFVVLYAGNIGLTSNLDEVLDAAGLMRERKDIQFVIIGDGVIKERLIQRVSQEKLENVLILPYQPRTILPQVMAAADMGLVTLNADSAPFSLPGKTFNIMASGRAILAMCPVKSELADLVNLYQCGVVVPCGDIHGFTEVVLQSMTKAEALKRMGSNARSALETVFSRKNFLEAFERIIVTSPYRKNADASSAK